MTGTHNSEPLDHLEPRLAARAVKRVAEEEWGAINMDRWAPELFLISLLAAFCGGLAWIHDHELFAAAFAAAAVVAASQARPP